MIDKSKNEGKSVLTPVVAGVMGAAAGAAAVMLASKNNREKVVNTVSDIREKGMKFGRHLRKNMDQLKKETQDTKRTLRKKLPRKTHK
ncbi:hypothetical protein A2773_04350 [Candidatus Gottesmanbacteria bacterium RIFCSPHIGHO2_01_FULL_39_10]|uniref:YtxH domain-containing protein n=1 Tax=Candidatus Gottesmanbacteria bacterium RIFCSPHIGHO2_01_FULL_39_10 TaxID=1798375 RepID=A0A1F5ZRY1_9BACT|nr:MAG: hypothetical protein A2773_04350 [Candidatus Gottesmanbacteria bacterium RIFCSPHIGHO2_01_FULL_39_10]